MSERRARRLIKADRKTVRYRSRRPRDDALRGRLRELAAEQRRFGYRRLRILLRAEGQVLNRKRTQRLYREEGLTVRKRNGRKRATGMRAPILVEARPNANLNPKLWLQMDERQGSQQPVVTFQRLSIRLAA